MAKVSFIGDANQDLIGERVEVTAWVHQRRRMGKIIFLILRDRTGDIQVVFKNLDETIMKRVNDVTVEDVISVVGQVQKKISQGKELELEVIAEDFKLISDAATPPISPTTIKETTEQIRLKYRYLDLRSEEKSKMLILRNNLQEIVDRYMRLLGFISIHTPLLSKATPEGSRDFLVPSREYPNKYYALPQSPQIYKQLLMASGVEKYYQIAPSFRDEDARADRHQEFYEIDIEASNIKGDDIRKIVTYLMKKIALLIMTPDEVQENVSFQTMKYETAMNEYGTDKPDVRFKMKFISAAHVFNDEIREKFGIDKKNSPLLFLEGDGNQFKKIDEIIEKMTTINNQHDYKRGFTIVWFDKAKVKLYRYRFINGKGIKKSIAILYDDIPLNIVDNVLVFAKWQGKSSEAWKKLSIMSQMRNYWGQKYLLDKTQKKLSFVWVVNFPLFEIEKETQTLTSSHHPFTKPMTKIKKEMISQQDELLKVISTSYDLVCNGYELGSGSERIVNHEEQSIIFKCLGISKKVAKDKFGFLLESMHYGTPPHAGIGLGFERILMVLLNKNNIRDVIPFPKTADGAELMTGSPTKID